MRPRPFRAAVGACATVWALALIGLGGVRMYVEWSQFHWERSVLQSGVASAAFHPDLPLIPIEAVVGLCWLAASPVWLALAVVNRVNDRTLRATGYLAAVALGLLLAAALLLWPGGVDAQPGPGFGLRLLTPAFVRSALLVCLGVCGLAATAWALLRVRE